MKQKITILFLLATAFVSAQISYKGFIDKYPIEFVTDIYSDGQGTAIYAYSNYDTPIVLNAKLNGKTLVFTEKDKNDKETAKLSFENYSSESDQLNGIWKDLNSGKELKISLIKEFDLNYNNGEEWTEREILQPVSLKDKYFKLVILKEKGSSTVSGIKIIEKKTDKLIQKVDIECQLWGLHNINVGDYNFDGFEEFSVFESSYAGPNTSRIYFLYNPKTGKYFESGFSGTSLEFDNKTKRIYEHNQCCAGRSVERTEYKVVNNKMVLIKKTCMEYDDKTQDYKKIKCD
ncbi:XAC2610-related protein [Flavobacterium sp. MMS24-S5]|uniref:XAC2610-related protein n=1 Tax=Flavobacterium sp. MMS24-S5 TaxID=3416605 RepID=UPI003D033DA9